MAHASVHKGDYKVAAEEVPDYCELLTRYFVRLNPNKVANVGALLAHYAGRELELFEKLEDKYGAPVFARAAAKSNGDIYDRLTDCSKYTGAHKNRFDKTGAGKGLTGRDYVSKGAGTANHVGNSRGFSGNTNTKTEQIFHDSSQFLMR